MTNFHKTSTSLNLHKDFYTVQEVALLLEKSDQTIYRWCESGKLLAKSEKYGSKVSFRIPKNALTLYLQQQEQAQLLTKPNKKPKVDSSVSQKDFLDKFKKACLQGVLTGRPFSNYTVNYYGDHIKKFYEGADNLSYQSLMNRLLEIPAEQFATKEKIYKALVCYAKFLVLEGVLEQELIDKLKPLKPKRHKAPKRISVSADDLEKMLAVCTDIQDKLIITMLAHTGLRAGEYGTLKMKDIDLEKRTLVVQCGKGGKTRTVGITNELAEVITQYLGKYPRNTNDYLHPNDLGRRMCKDGVYQRVRRIGDEAGVTAASHALRRAFVTINANKGRSLVMIQLACGHSDIKTTRDYCRTSEDDLINAMKEWG